MHSCQNILEQALMNFLFAKLSVDRFLLIGSETLSMRWCLPFMSVYFPLCLHPPALFWQDLAPPAGGEAYTVPSARNVYPFAHSGPLTHPSFCPESFLTLYTVLSTVQVLCSFPTQHRGPVVWFSYCDCWWTVCSRRAWGHGLFLLSAPSPGSAAMSGAGSEFSPR